MRKTVAIVTKGFYLLLTEMIAMYLMVFPVHAFQVSSSSTGYVRVAQASAVAAYQAANRAAFTGALASAISAPTVASVAVRLATGPVGWGLLGVTAALTLAQMYYSSADVQTVKTAALATLPTVTTVNGVTQQSDSVLTNGCATLTVNCTQQLYIPNGRTFQQCQAGMSPSPPSGWTAQNQAWVFAPACYWLYTFQYTGSNGAQRAFVAPPPSMTLTQAQTYTAGLSTNGATSPETHTTPAGQGVANIAADNVTTVQVTPDQVVPTVKPATQVTGTDAVLDPNAPPPSGPQPVQAPTTESTTTTTTTTNPNGSVTTETTEEPGLMSCTAGNHDQRSFGTVLQAHMTLWQGSGLAGALNLIKNLTWPETIPTYSLTSNTFGNFTIDFSGWSGVLLALRGLVIALASFVAYRIIFVGSK